jgi:hypothetical protein
MWFRRRCGPSGWAWGTEPLAERVRGFQGNRKVEVSRKRHLLTNWKCCVSGVHDEKFANDAPKQGKFQYKMWLMLTPSRLAQLAEQQNRPTSHNWVRFFHVALFSLPNQRPKNTTSPMKTLVMILCITTALLFHTNAEAWSGAGHQVIAAKA